MKKKVQICSKKVDFMKSGYAKAAPRIVALFKSAFGKDWDRITAEIKREKIHENKTH